MPSTAEMLGITPMIPAGDDVATSVAFYTGKLGFATRFTQGEPIELAGVHRGGVELLLYRNADRHLADNTSFRIRVAGVDALHAELVAAGVAIHPNGGMKETPWGTREFALIDPAGVCIAFYEPRG